MAQFSSDDMNERFSSKKHVEKVRNILTNFRMTEEDFVNSYLAAEYANQGGTTDFLL